MKIRADHERFRDSVRAFVDAEIAPHVNAWDEARAFPRELHRRATHLDLLSLADPEQ